MQQTLESDIQSQGLYVHTHSNNGQGKCSIISRYPFSGITPNKYGAYIDLGEGIIVLVMNCHGAFYPYGPFQLNGIEYKGYEGTDDVDYVVKVNKEARQGMVDKLLEDLIHLPLLLFVSRVTSMNRHGLTGRKVPWQQVLLHTLFSGLPLVLCGKAV